MSAAQDPIQNLLRGYLIDWQIQLQSMAVSGALMGAASQSLEAETALSYLRDLNTRLAAGDWSDLPQVELLEAEEMGGVVDAWTSSTRIIYLKSDWLSSASSIQVATLLTEKFIDSFCVPSEREDAVACEPEPISRIIAGEGVSGNYRLAIDSDGWWNPGSAEFDAAESTFGVDANQDGIIGPLKNLNSNSSSGSSTQDEFDILTNYTNITCVMPPNAWSTIHADKEPRIIDCFDPDKQIIDCFDPQVGIICVCPGIACDNPPFSSEFNSDLTSIVNQDFTQVLRPLPLAI